MIDDGEGSTWSDFTLFPPWIADDRDGCAFRNLPARFQHPLDPVEGGGKPDACRVTRDVLSLHSSTDTDERQDDHAA